MPNRNGPRKDGDMQVTPTLETLKRAVRMKVCARCPNRPAGSEVLPAGVPRDCEGRCPVFVHLPLIQLVGRRVDPTVADRGRVLRALLMDITHIYAERGGVIGRPAADRRGCRNPDQVAVLRRNGRKVARVVDELMGG
jgi:hypothetical protein